MFKKTRLFLLAMSVTLIFQTSCIDEIAPGNYYTFTGDRKSTRLNSSHL